ncbi:nucleopolyhedrovirus P10 family protein [Streptomyces populi]|uniref:Nucleopolyhedrovirus P10 family protein n=1 Tax=Streptomyces populi TaxID=2058924 RepID=A0A2I0SS72_9ACTN|nr:nucleopolyhedrovirus P10 family protein [Streptomyces populi]PKT72777.1 nucleopolyhedrovirus P10 family protein [Streptomyces populi]
MTADRWTQGVRHQLGLGRLLPLGLALDGAWITEEAAGAVLRRETAAVEGVRLGTLRIALADPDRAGTPAVPPPPGAVPPGPLRVSAEFRVSVDPTSPGAEPLPSVAARLRLAVVSAATRLLGLDVVEVDLRVTDLLEEDGAPAAHPAGVERGAPAAVPAAGVREARAVPPADGVRGTRTAVPADGAREGRADARATGARGTPAPAPADGAGTEPAAVPAADGPDDGVPTAPVPRDPEGTRIAAAALAVPGVTRLTDILGRPVRVESTPATDPALPRRHIRVELEVSGDERTVDVARAVRSAITETARDTPSVAVLVTSVTPGTPSRRP